MHKEVQHQIPESGAERLVVVTHDVSPVLLQLDQSVLSLQVQNVALRSLLHLYFCDAVLAGNRTH